MMGSYEYTGVGLEVDADAAWEYIRNGYLLAPRTVLKGRAKLAKSIALARPVNLQELPSAMLDTLMAVMGKMDGSPRAVMFSGGFDSMLIASLAQHAGADVTAVTVQFEGFNPKTVAGSIEFANRIGIKHHILHVKAVEFLSAFEKVAGITQEPLLDLELAIVYAAFKNYDPRVAGDVFISGMGCDQWFGNLAYYAKPEDIDVRLDWASVNEDAHHRVAQTFGRKFIFPFISAPMLALSQSLPLEMKKDKKFLRALAVAHTIPYRGARSEEQTPPLMRHILIKQYGHRAWPGPVAPVINTYTPEFEQAIRQIILGLWLEKAKPANAIL